MILSASDFYTLYRPTKCERRVYLRAHKEPESEPSEFDKLLEELGRRHESNHLSSFDKFEDLREGSLEQRAKRTRQAVDNGAEVIYQGVLQSAFPDSSATVFGIPDFLIKDAGRYRIRDCKLARHADEERHPEIVLQLQLYGWLFESSLKQAPSALEVYLGDQSIAQILYSSSDYALEILEKIKSLASQTDEPYSPVGWSKCGACGFQERCWGIAESIKDVSLVYELDQGTAIALRQQGVNSIEELLARFTESSLSELKKARGQQVVRIGKAASRILLQARALLSGEEKLLAPLALPTSDNLVMFDLEGLPPNLDELDKIYPWGMQVFGKKPGKYMAGLAGFGRDGDRTGWEEFLTKSKSIFDEYGDIPFIHWAHYEATKVNAYITRYGDIDGIAQRVLNNCVDLLKITRQALVLPEYSYSLKVIEKRVGFKRTMDEYGGNWSIAQYIRAVETEDEKLQQQIMSQILKYNEEDLQATWAVLQWLKSKNK